jgi:hypothetical protein
MFGHILNSITGMVFLGTPFSGSDSAGLALYVVSAARVLGYDTHKELLEKMVPNSDALFDLRYQFELIARSMQFSMVCFFEQIPTAYFRWKRMSFLKKEMVSSKSEYLENK